MNSEIDALLKKTKRIVIKLGTQVVTQLDGSLAFERMCQLAVQCKELQNLGHQVVIVSSGAVGLGRKKISHKNSLSLHEKQACAAIGQPLLMNSFSNIFQKSDIEVAQILLTSSGLLAPKSLENFMETTEKLLDWGILPILNENDSIATDELEEKNKSKFFGDNDHLSAMVSWRLKADLLIILTNVNGVYLREPKGKNENEEPIPWLKSQSELSSLEIYTKSGLGTGGIKSKLEASNFVGEKGIPALILSGHRENSVLDYFSGKNRTGTFIKLFPDELGKVSK